MSVYFCVGCNQYIDSDVEGMHSTDEGEICDMCECKNHDDFYNESMNEFKKMIGEK
jgi:hypothetical protein